MTQHQRRARRLVRKGLKLYREAPRCPHDGKASYRSSAHAEVVAIAQQGGRVYWCAQGQAWHLTSGRRPPRPDEGQAL